MSTTDVIEQYRNQWYQRTAEIESRALFGLDIKDRYRQEAALALRAADVEFRKGERILDLACGEAHHAEVMAALTGGKVAIDARDISQPLIEAAQTRIQSIQKTLHINIHVAHGDMTHIRDSLPSDVTYRLITILGSSFMYLGNRDNHEKALRDYYDILPPGGKLTIQFRDMANRLYDPDAHRAWCERFHVASSRERAQGAAGKFGQFAQPEQEVTTFRDSRRKDGFYYYPSKPSNTEGLRFDRHPTRPIDCWMDSDNVEHYAFGRAYIDEDGREENLGTTEITDYMSEKNYPILKQMLEKTGFKNVELQQESLSPDGSWKNFAVVAEK